MRLIITTPDELVDHIKKRIETWESIAKNARKGGAKASARAEGLTEALGAIESLLENGALGGEPPGVVDGDIALGVCPVCYGVYATPARSMLIPLHGECAGGGEPALRLVDAPVGEVR